MKSSTNLSPELQKAKLEIDNTYKSNPLLNLSFTHAISTYLSFDQEYWYDMLGEISVNELTRYEKMLMNRLLHPISWLYNGCNHNNDKPTTPDENQSTASKELYELGMKYSKFHQAFILANYGILDLEIKDSMIHVSEDYQRLIEYKIYNLLIASHKPDIEPDEFIDETKDPMHEIYDIIKVKKDSVIYPLNPKLVTDISEYFKPFYNLLFILSKDLEFIGYSMNELRLVIETLFSLTYIHKTACEIAFDTDIDYEYYYHDTYMPSCTELINRIVRYTGVTRDKVQQILDDLTYRNSNHRNSNLCLHPIIKLNAKYYAFSSVLWNHIQTEWSMNGLLCKLPSESDISDEFSQVKNAALIEKINSALSSNKHEILCISDEGLPKDYILIVHHNEKVCLIIDLKWYIQPYNIYTSIERSEEIRIACSQMLKYKQEITENEPDLLEKFNIDANYRFEGVIAPENWIGYGNIHTPEIPIIQVYHLINKLEAMESLNATMDWLIDREYMPKIGEDFSILDEITTIGSWSLQTYGVKKHIEGRFYPL